VKKQDLDALMCAAARETGGAAGATAPLAVPDVPGKPAPRGTAEVDDQVRLTAILKAIEEAAARKNPHTRFAPLAYCIAVDGARDYGDPEPPAGAMPDDDLFMQGPRDEPSAGLMRDIRGVHPLARTWADCPAFEPGRADWWRAPVHVFVRRLFWLGDGSVKVPVMQTRPHSGCYGFVFYHARRAEERWTLTAPDYRHSLCH